jgi:hypothetical protein
MTKINDKRKLSYSPIYSYQTGNKTKHSKYNFIYPTTVKGSYFGMIK